MILWGQPTHQFNERNPLATKTVAEKLRIKPNTSLWTSHFDRLALVGELPEGVTHVDGPADAAVALVFVDDARSAHEVLGAHKDALARAGIVWIAYPKGNTTDINRDTLWPIAGEYGLRPNSQIAVDDTWSALRFRPLKPGEAPFTGGKG